MIWIYGFVGWVAFLAGCIVGFHRAVRARQAADIAELRGRIAAVRAAIQRSNGAPRLELVHGRRGEEPREPIH